MSNLSQKDKNILKELTEIEIDWLKMMNSCSQTGPMELLQNVDNMRFNFADYLKDAKAGIQECKSKCRDWTCQYNDSLFKYDSLLKNNINVDADEYLLNLFTEELSDEDENKSSSIFQ